MTKDMHEIPICHNNFFPVMFADGTLFYLHLLYPYNSKQTYLKTFDG